MADQNFQSWSRDMSPPSLQIAGFSDYNIFRFYWHFLLQYWFSAVSSQTWFW